MDNNFCSNLYGEDMSIEVVGFVGFFLPDGYHSKLLKCVCGCPVVHVNVLQIELRELFVLELDIECRLGEKSTCLR